MKVSEIFSLGRSQYELDFVDIDPEKDIQLFLDPYFLSSQDDPWCFTASRTLRSFFDTFVRLVRAGDESRARALFSHLGEPNETCLGLSKGRPSGRGVGQVNADQMFESLLTSRAVVTGLVEHLEDVRLFVTGIDKDKVSDMTTNILRQHLLDYTATQCRLWGIPLRPGVAAGMVWSAKNARWEPRHAEMLVVDERRILLVPKAVVSFAEKYAPRTYHQHFVLNFLQNDHLRLGTALVQRRRLKDGTEKRFVTKTSLAEGEAAYSKEFLTAFTERHPDVFKGFRDSARVKSKRIANENLTNEPLEGVIGHLIRRLTETLSGRDHATQYHRTVIGILELVFYPNLFAPQIEREIDDGRKRIDITFDNGADSGFFKRLQTQFGLPCQYVLAECKNYTHDVANPELDQLAGRLSPNRGKFGLMVCRTVEDMPTLLKRCRDHYQADHGIILPLTDDDLKAILEGLGNGIPDAAERLLTQRLRDVVLK